MDETGGGGMQAKGLLQIVGMTAMLVTLTGTVSLDPAAHEPRVESVLPAFPRAAAQPMSAVVDETGQPVDSPQPTSYSVSGPALDKWRSLLGAGVNLGSVISNPHADPSGWQTQGFASGTIVTSPTGETLASYGPIWEHWQQAGGPLGHYGYPTDSVGCSNGTCVQHFQHGSLGWNSFTGVLELPAPDPACLHGRALCADKTTGTLQYVVNGTVQYVFQARFGRPGFDTTEGVQSVLRKVPDEVSRPYNNSPMPFAIYFTDSGEAVHFSADFLADSNPEGSHGCVNIKDYQGLAWVYNQVQVGDQVVVYRS